MRIALFCHSLLSDWNHGNAHFLRGVVAELDARGHGVTVFEPEDAWSLRNLLAHHGASALDGVRAAYPWLMPVRYRLSSLDLDGVLARIDVVLVHEWNDPDLVRRVGEHRDLAGRYRLLFHDTHHRLVTSPPDLARLDLSRYDGVLAFGQVLRDLYLVRGLARRAWVWHEAADTRVFRPLPTTEKELDLIWIGNWGDEERTAELREFLIEPVKALGLRARVYGVRYPASALAALADAGIEYAGWLPNHRVPDALARARVAVHIPRRPYAAALPGIPTIRPFEVLACGIPLVCAPWTDAERLFSPGDDYWVATSGAEMKSLLRALLGDPERAQRLAEHGRRTIVARHTCAHRVDALLDILDTLTASSLERTADGSDMERDDTPSGARPSGSHPHRSPNA